MENNRRWTLNKGNDYKIGPLSMHVSKGFMWVRIGTYRGLLFKKLSLHPKIFSERNGYKKHIVLFGWLIRSV